jgi:hypothetical protein
LTHPPSFVYVLYIIVHIFHSDDHTRESKCCCKLVLIISVHVEEKFKDSKEVTRSRKSTIQCETKKDDWTNNDLHSIAQKTKDQAPKPYRG